MKHRVIAIGLLVLCTSGSAGAQVKSASSAVVKPTVNPTTAQTIARPGALNAAAFMATGPYTLVLHAQKKNNQPVTASDFETQTAVSRTGGNITITASDGMALSGTVSGTQMHANGTASSGGTLALTGTEASGNGSTGTFTAHDGSTTLTGTYALYPGLNMGPNNTAKIRNYGDPKPGSGTDGGGGTCGFWCQLKQWFGL